MAVEKGDGHCELLQEEDEGVGTMGGGGGGTDKMQGGGGHKIEGEGGWDGNGDHARRCWEELAHVEGQGGNHDRGSSNSNSNGEGGGTEEEFADLPTCGRKRREELR
jgi:hypothetical protein